MARQWYNKRWNDSKNNDVDMVDCGNPECSRTNLSVAAYNMQGIREGTSEDRIHHVCLPRLSDVTIICPQCGHFTVFYKKKLE